MKATTKTIISPKIENRFILPPTLEVVNGLQSNSDSPSVLNKTWVYVKTALECAFMCRG
jgi:hypothetical protein